MSLTEEENKQLDEQYARAVEVVMQQVRAWVTSKGGATGELHLKKSYESRTMGGWTINIVEVKPESTFHLGI